MKKKMLLLLTFFIITIFLLTGCSSNSYFNKLEPEEQAALLEDYKAAKLFNDTNYYKELWTEEIEEFDPSQIQIEEDTEIDGLLEEEINYIVTQRIVDLFSVLEFKGKILPEEKMEITITNKSDKTVISSKSNILISDYFNHITENIEYNISEPLKPGESKTEVIQLPSGNRWFQENVYSFTFREKHKLMFIPKGIQFEDKSVLDLKDIKLELNGIQDVYSDGNVRMITIDTDTDLNNKNVAYFDTILREILGIDSVVPAISK